MTRRPYSPAAIEMAGNLLRQVIRLPDPDDQLDAVVLLARLWCYHHNQVRRAASVKERESRADDSIPETVTT